MAIKQYTTGHKLGVLTVVRFHKTNRHGHALWICKCVCGRQFAARLYNKEVTRCVCKHRRAGSMVKNRTTKSRITREMTEYRIWSTMKQRCYDPACKSFRDYGARGIVVCERWNHFENFLADMGPRPSPRHTLNRIDNDGSYCKENCQWADWDTQANNRRNNLLVTFNGKTQTLSRLARQIGVKYSSLYARIKAGVPVESAIKEAKKTGGQTTLL